MQLKRIFVSLLVVILMLSATVIAVSAEDVILTTSAPAAVENFELAVDVSSAAGSQNEVLTFKKGEKVDVSVTIVNNPGVAYYEFYLDFDAKALAPVVNDKGALVVESDIYGYSVINVKDNYIKFVTTYGEQAANVVKTGVTLKFSFNVIAEGCATAPVAIRENAFVYNADLKAVDYKVDADAVYVHTFAAGKTVAPTCQSEGWYEFTCPDCKELVKANVVPAADHNVVAIEAVAPTCVATGLTEGSKCADCGTVFVEQTEVPATGEHTPVDVPATEATCKVPGVSAGTKCSVCSAVLSGFTSTGLGDHVSEVVPAVEATCTTAGATEGAKCSVCGVVTTAPQTVQPKGHTEVVIPAVEPTYSEDGATEGKKCSVCDEILVAPQVVPAKTLTWLWIVIAVVVVVGAGAAVYFFVIRKKSK